MFPMCTSYFLHPSYIHHVVNMSEFVDIIAANFDLMLIRNFLVHSGDNIALRKIDDDRIKYNYAFVTYSLDRS